jgi:thymidine phosphorylase
MCAELGGPHDIIESYQNQLPHAKVARPVFASGYLQSVQTRAVGNAIIGLGGGRKKVGEKLDLSVGFSSFASVGSKLDEDLPLAVVHAASAHAADQAERSLLAACRFGPEPPAERAVICDILSG